MFTDKFKIVLVEPQISGNIGAVARAMMNMGFTQLCLVNPRAHHLNRESLDRALEAHDLLHKASIFQTLEEAINPCHQVFGTSGKNFPSLKFIGPRDFTQKLKAPKKNIALVFGPEDTGLKKKQLLLCDQVIQISSSPKFPSLNLSHAVMVVLYEIYVSRNSLDRPKKALLATAAQKEDFYKHLQEALLGIDFLDANNPDRIMKTLRNIYSRADLEERDIRILRGICRQIQNRTSPSLPNSG